MTAEQFPRPDSRDGFDVAILCALQVEFDAVYGMLDEDWEADDFQYQKPFWDPNDYTFGRIGRHNVVIACLPGIGKRNAASTAATFAATFRNVRLGLLVGICGAVPETPTGEEIMLGDVIIGTRVRELDLGRQHTFGLVRRKTGEDDFALTNSEIRSFAVRLNTKSARNKLRQGIEHYLQETLQSHDFADSISPSQEFDKLYHSGYQHRHRDPHACVKCASLTTEVDDVCDEALKSSCAELGCEDHQLIRRTRLESSDGHMLHFGTIGCSDKIIRSASVRDKFARDEDIIGFEMEGVGMLHSFPTIVVKAVSDYADSHKNKMWQKHAALVAACCTKALLTRWRVVDKVNLARSEHQKQKWASYRVLATMTAMLIVAFGIYVASPNFKQQPSWSSQQRRLLDANRDLYAVLGKTGVGKSSFINTVGGRHIITRQSPHIEHSLRSGTRSIEIYEFDSHSGPGYIIDTPGIDDNTPETEDNSFKWTNLDIMMLIRNELQKLNNTEKLLAGLVYLYDIQQRRVERGDFEGLNMTVNMVEHLLGTNGIARITLATTGWKQTPTYEEKTKEEEHER